MTTDPLTREILCAAIERQKALIKEMDFPPNPDFHQPGSLMASIRQEKLDLLEKLLEFYAP